MASSRRRGLVAAVAAIAMGIAIVVGWKTVRHDLFPRNFGVVEEGRIYRSGRLTPSSMRRLIREHGIRTIVDLGAYDTRPEMGETSQEIADELGVSKYTIYLRGDGRGNPNGYVQALRIMAAPENAPVLVQCAAGSQRTGAAVLLYRAVIQGVPVQQAYEETFEHGHEPEVWELLAYVADWIDEIAAAYRSGSWVPGVEPVEARPGAPVDARRGALPESVSR